MSQSDQSKGPNTPDEKEQTGAAKHGPESEVSCVHKPKTFGRRLLSFFFVCFYIVFLVAVVVGCLAAVEYYAYLKIKSSSLGEAYKDKGLDLARQSSQKVAPQYGYEPTPGFVAVRDTHLGNSYEYINEESFKDFDEVPRDKPTDEYRVIVTGGSVIYGRGPVPPMDAITNFYEVTFRWTIPHIMEMIMNADPDIKAKIGGKKVRVINAGAPGYVYQNELMRYLAKLRLYQPDLIVSLDGANEVGAVSKPLKDYNYLTEGQYYEVVTDVMDMGRKGLINYVTLWLKCNTYFFTWLALERGEGPGILFENRAFPAHPQDATPEMIEFRNKNIKQVADVMAIYHKTLETDRVPHVFALQPMFQNCKKKRTPIEEKINSMQKVGFFDAAQTYDVFVDTVKKRGQEIGFDVADLTGVFDKVNEWVFTDWCHLTNGANYVIAKELVDLVKTRVFSLPLGPDDSLKNPADPYFKDYAKHSTVLVNGRPPEGQLRILKGYPGPELLEVASERKSEVSGVVLDMGEALPVSRLRIVWGDEKSVPKSWSVELSQDGKDWQTWLNVADTKTDAYDQWPGFEYYAHKETVSRYVRYVPRGEDADKPIRLRQLSAFR